MQLSRLSLQLLHLVFAHALGGRGFREVLIGDRVDCPRCSLKVLLQRHHGVALRLQPPLGLGSFALGGLGLLLELSHGGLLPLDHLRKRLDLGRKLVRLGARLRTSLLQRAIGARNRSSAPFTFLLLGLRRGGAKGGVGGGLCGLCWLCVLWNGGRVLGLF